MLKRFIFVVCLLTILITGTWATDWFVYNSVTGEGKSWTDAWNDFDDIQWDLIDPGDTIYISGGSTNKTYSDRLSIVDVNGSAISRITIRVSQDTEHNGTVILTNDGPNGGIFLQDSAYVTINGSVGKDIHMSVSQCSTSGVFINYGNSHHIIVEYLDIYKNGDDTDDDGFVVKYNGDIYPYVELRYCTIHDNSQDQIKAFGGGHSTRGFGAILVHHNEIYNIHDDGFESGAGGVDFYNNEMHTRVAGGGNGHSDGLQFYSEYYRIYNNIFRNFNQENLSSTAYIYILTLTTAGKIRNANEIYI